MERFRVVPSTLPRFSGGLAGYFSYDLVSSIYPVRCVEETTDPVAGSCWRRTASRSTTGGST